MNSSFSHWAALVRLLVKRDLKVRYRGSALGYIWSMVNPLLMMSVLVFVFSYAMRIEMEHYAIYILSGIMAWNVFAQSMFNGVRCFADNSSLMKKVKVPAWVFPTAVIGAACVHAGVALVPYFIIATVLGLKWHWTLIQLPFVFLIYFFFIEGLVLTLGSLHVFFRDIGHIIEPALQILFYATPIIYPLQVIPDKYRFVVDFNPMSYFMEAFRAALYSSQWVAWQNWVILSFITLVFFAIGYITFKRSEKKFLYYL